MKNPSQPSSINGEEKCHLCKVGKVYHIKSHLTPAVISSSTFGSRNKEEIYTINSAKGTMEKYFGPENDQREEVEIKIAPNVIKGIFCKLCEENLAKIEERCQSIINETTNLLGRNGGYQVLYTNNNIKYTLLDIHPNIIALFYYSIVWRQCLQQSLGSNDNPLTPEQFEQLRQIIYENIYKSIEDIKTTNFSLYPRIILLTSYNTMQLSYATFVNPNSIVSNPYLFFISSINVLYFTDENLTQNILKKIGIKEELLDKDLNIAGAEVAKLAILNRREWGLIKKIFVQREANKYIKSINN